MLEILTGEASKGYKKEKLWHNEQKQWINIHYWRGSIVTAEFKFTYTL